MSEMSFYLGDHPKPTWEAVRFGSLWNGFATPVVTREVLQSILDSIAPDRPHCWDGATAWVSHYGPEEGITAITPAAEDASELRAEPDGLYDLSYLGFMFIRCGDDYLL